ncbi:MAG: shikimate kinase [Lachnospiraceae bacterium]|nr:shikimate kinase [Lachnospiraceae bacterium]
MKYGLIGEKLSHSFSPQIHGALGSTPYELKELAPEELESFLLTHDFKGVNVTIPYKQAVIPYLSKIDPAAARIGAVNTIVVGPDGTLSGYNTDYFGIEYALQHAGIRVAGKKALILGSGGTSHTARTVLYDLGASEIVIVSRRKANAVALQENDAAGSAKPSSDVKNDIAAAPAQSVPGTQGTSSVGNASEIPVVMTDYENVISDHSDAQIILNTTPVGMFPNNGKSPLDLSRFKDLEGVVDVIYNPLRSALLMQAEELGIPCTNGLTMLVAQAKAAAEYFLGKKIPDSEIANISRGLRDMLTNIVLIGMPGSGKSSVGKMLAEMLEREFVDLDNVIEDTADLTIPEMFEKCGEDYFRDLETAVARKEGAAFSKVIATGGGIVLRDDNYAPLAQNGYIVCLERDLSKLPLDGRPLSKSPEALVAMQKRRAPYYEHFADASIDNNGTRQETLDHILAMFGRRR